MKRLVLCADGTWNKRDQIDKDTGKRRPTNVTKVARAVLSRASDGVDQVVFYRDGLGTRDPLDRFTGGAFGHGIEDNIRDLYRFVIYNHEPGDALYFFGFSRGAFTVRSLAGFMNQVGVIEKDGDYFVPDLYKCYQSGALEGSEAWKSAFRKIRTVSRPPIKFIGVWDTVGALGAPGLLGQFLNPGRYKYHNVGLHAGVENAVQALAIDERRRPFKPNVWSKPVGWTGSLEQTWFPGVHSNVGGGCAPDGLANEALHWAIEKAERAGLEFDSEYLAHFTPCFNSTLHDSMSMLYRAMGPITRRLGETGGCESIHQSVHDRIGHEPSAYSPQNVAGCVLPVINTTRIGRGTPCS